MGQYRSDRIIGRLTGILPALGIFVIGAVAFATLLRSIPAFDTESRREGIFGDWRVPVTASLYNRADYLFQVGFSFLQGDVIASAATEERDTLAPQEVALERAAFARQNLEDSIALAPANPYAWTFLGWARAMEGDVEGAVDALAASWELAPFSAQLATIRLNLAEVLVEIDEGFLRQEATRLAVTRDLEAMARFDGRYFRILLEDSGPLSDLAADADLLDR